MGFYAKAVFLRYTGIVFLTLPTLNKWINKNKKTRGRIISRLVKARVTLAFWLNFKFQVDDDFEKDKFKIIWYENRITVEIFRVSFIVFIVGLFSASSLNLNSCSAIVSYIQCINEHTVGLSWVILSLISVGALRMFIVWLCNNLVTLDANGNKNWAQFKSTRNGELNIIWSVPLASAINFRSCFLLSLAFCVMIFKQWIINPNNIQKPKLEICRSTHLVSERSLIFLRYIVLIPFSTVALLKDSTHFSSNSYYLGEYLNKLLTDFL